jgi:hypothetical protein
VQQPVVNAVNGRADICTVDTRGAPSVLLHWAGCQMGHPQQWKYLCSVALWLRRTCAFHPAQRLCPFLCIACRVVHSTCSAALVTSNRHQSAEHTPLYRYLGQAIINQEKKNIGSKFKVGHAGPKVHQAPKEVNYSSASSVVRG